MPDDPRPLLVFVGGFLGAGKTTLLLRAAETLQRRGQRVAVILNDQDSGLVDTSHANAIGLASREVTRGCFCCRYSDLLDAATELRRYEPEVLLAEPVGSCVDLCATILQPLLSFQRNEFRVAPLTVVVDPFQMLDLLEHRVDENTGFLMRNQIAEADFICLTKQDLYAVDRSFPMAVDFRVSGKTGFGVEDWLDQVLASTLIPGSKLLDLDYDDYARAEASLGWLNLHANLTLREPLSPATVVGPMLDGIADRLEGERVSIAHLKIFDRSDCGWVRASVTGNGQRPEATGDLMADGSLHHQLVINLRAVAAPECLRSTVLEVIGRVPGEVELRHLAAFSPARPSPEHRFQRSMA